MARILVVDDSSFQRRMIRGLLTRMGRLDLGALRVLNKPPKEADLREALEDALAAPEAAR
jgi:CheY-like chemotaxis protein